MQVYLTGKSELYERFVVTCLAMSLLFEQLMIDSRQKLK